MEFHKVHRYSLSCSISMILLGEIIHGFYISLSKLPVDTMESLKQDPTAVVEWLRVTKVEISPDKLEVMSPKHL